MPYIIQLWRLERVKNQRFQEVHWDIYFCYWLYMQNSQILGRWEVEWKPEEIASISENVTISDFAKVTQEMGIRPYKYKVFSHASPTKAALSFPLARAAANHIYILDVVQKKGEMNFQIFFLLHRLFITYSVVACNARMQNDSRTNVFIHNVGKQRSSWRVISHTILPWQFFLLWFKKLQAVEKVPFESVLNVKYKIHFCTTLIQMPEFWAKLSIWLELHELCLSKQLSLELEVRLMHIINIFFRKRQPLFLCDYVIWHPQTSWLELFVRCLGTWVLYTRAIGWENKTLEREEQWNFSGSMRKPGGSGTIVIDRHNCLQQ